MRKATGLLFTSFVVAAVLGLVTWFGYAAYRDARVQMAASAAENFVPPPPPTGSARSDDPPLKIQPRPDSSPLHDRHFDEAVAEAHQAYDLDDYPRAIAAANRALDLHPSSDLRWVLLIFRGDCHVAGDQPDQALDDYKAAEQIAPLSTHAHISRSMALQESHQPAAAMEAINTALKAEPDNPRTLVRRAWMFLDSKDDENALRDFTRALQLRPSYTSARVSVAGIYLKRKQPYKAITECTIAMKLDGNAWRARVERAKALAQLGMYSKALGDLNFVLSRGTGDADALNAVAWILATAPASQLRDGRTAFNAAVQACELDKWKRWELIDTLAASYAEVGEFDNAVEYESRAMKAAPASGKAYASEHLNFYSRKQPYRQPLAD